MTRTGALVTLLLGLMLSHAAAAGPDAQRVTLGYDLYAASLPAARLDIALQMTGHSYRVAGDLRTMGLADMRVRWRAAQVSQGRLVDGRVQPSRYSNRGEWREVPRSAVLTYGAGASVVADVSPTAEADRRPPVAAEQRRGTVDFMSAMVQLAFADDPAAACAGTRQIFDGRRRYDMVLTAERAERLPAQRLSAYEGEALRCLVTTRRIGGFPPHGDGFDIPDKLYLWLAREPRSGLVLPVRVQAATEYGTAVIHLSSVAVADERQARRTD